MAGGADRTETQRPLGDLAVRRDAEAPMFAPGEVIADRYRVLRFIARGGMGEVYEVTDRSIGTPVALKAMRRTLAADAMVVRRFRREVELARRVTSEQVCRIFDTGTHDGADGEIPFLTMELLGGETLAARLVRLGRLEVEAARRVVEDLVAGLAAAHRAGVVHRDLKSGNVMLVPADAGRERVVITDFGLAHRETTDDDATNLTGGAIVGSPGYMAPEQVLGEHTGTATDVYALGVVMYELVTGQLPFRGETPMATAALRLKLDPPPPRTLVPELPLPWQTTILACLARDPARRPAPVEHVVTLLDERSPRRRRRTVAIALAVAAAAGAAATITISRGDRAAARPSADAAVEPPATPRPPRQTRLTTGLPGNIFVAAMSPDGKRVALSDARLRVIDDGGPPRDLALPAGTAAIAASWYRDSQRLLVSLNTDGGREIGVLDADDGGYEIIQSDAWGGAISPDGVHFASFTDGAVTINGLDGVSTRVLGPSRSAPYMTVAWSPDGRVLAALDGGGLRLIEVATGRLAPIPGLGRSALVEAGVTWLHDGRLVFGVMGNTGGATIVTIPVDAAALAVSGEPIELATFPTQQVTAIDSGDGARLTITTRAGAANVYVGDLAADGTLGEPRQLTRSVQYDKPLAFTRDGEALYINRQGQVFRTPLDGSAPDVAASFAAVSFALVDDGAAALIVHSVDAGIVVDETVLATGAMQRRTLLDATTDVYWSIECAATAARRCVAGQIADLALTLSWFDRERGVLEPIATVPGSRDTGAATWALSPDGATIALVAPDTGLSLLEVASGRRRAVGLPCSPQSATWLDAQHPVVSCMSGIDPRYQLRVIDPDGTSRLVTGTNERWMYQPVVDAARRQLAFAGTESAASAYLLELAP